MMLLEIQKNLVAPKDKSAGRYKYRNVEDLYERVKPLLDAPLSVTTEAVELGGQILIKAVARYKEMQSSAFCAVESAPKNMSVGQAYGAATSYATKYAICMLFCVDNGEDLDGCEIEKRKEPVNVSSEENKLKTSKAQLFSLLTQAGVGRNEAAAFYEAYCPNEVMLNRVIQHFDRFLNEWKTADKARVMK